MIKGNREIYEVSNLGKFIFLKGGTKMSGVKETICSKCVHLSICKYKDEMLATVEHFDKYMANSRFSYVVSCKDCMIKSSVAFRDH